jgi:hypothetical protein
MAILGDIRMSFLPTIRRPSFRQRVTLAVCQAFSDVDTAAYPQWVEFPNY